MSWIRILFFLSGAAGLIYQVVWTRLLSEDLFPAGWHGKSRPNTGDSPWLEFLLSRGKKMESESPITPARSP